MGQPLHACHSLCIAQAALHMLQAASLSAGQPATAPARARRPPLPKGSHKAADLGSRLPAQPANMTGPTSPLKLPASETVPVEPGCTPGHRLC